MQGSGFPIDLILFGMIAVFLVLRLRSILGRRTGFERQAVPVARPVPGVVPGRVIDAVAEPVSTRALPDPASPAGQAMARMQKVDRNFAAAKFLDGAEAAFRIIVTTFAAGDRATLRPLLSADTMASFEAAIEARAAAGHVQVSEVRAIPQATIEQAALAGTVADITVRFVSDQIALTNDATGHPVAGTDAVTELTDVWTFRRDLAVADPAWRLTAARSA